MRLEDYAITVTPLPADDGGGYLVLIPDLPGCMADGATIEGAIEEARDAFEAWVTRSGRRDTSCRPRSPAAASSSSASRRACTCNWRAGPRWKASA